MIIHATLAKGLLAITLGLIGKDKTPLLIQMPFIAKHHIHTFGVKFPIDIVWLDKNFTVVEIRTNIQPNKIIFSSQKSKYILETKSSYCETQSIKIGKNLDFAL